MVLMTKMAIARLLKVWVVQVTSAAIVVVLLICFLHKFDTPLARQIKAQAW
jgi:hypothetical protein